MTLIRFYYLLLIVALPSCVSDDLASIDDLFNPKTPGEAARDANNRESPDLQRQGINELSQAPFGGIEVYVNLYRDRLEYKETSGGPLVQAACLRALALHGEVSDAPLIASYLDKTENPNKQVRLASAKALQRIHNPQVVSRLTSTSRDVDEWYEVRIASIEALAQYKEERVLDLLIDLLNDRKLSINYVAHKSLIHLTGQEFEANRPVWIQWYQAVREDEKVLFSKDDYTYPVYDRELSWWEHLPIFAPYFESSMPPLGIYGEGRRTTYGPGE